jgi:hypothetical protein
VPVDNAIVGIDLADAKQMMVLTDHDSRVLARRTFRCRAWDLGVALDWAGQRAAARGFAGVTVACEPTGHRWRVLAQLASDRSMSFVCVQPMPTAWSRRAEDLTVDKTDEKEAVLIARLTTQLRCYEPEATDETWARLRYLGFVQTRSAARLRELLALIHAQWTGRGRDEQDGMALSMILEMVALLPRRCRSGRSGPRFRGWSAASHGGKLGSDELRPPGVRRLGWCGEHLPRAWPGRLPGSVSVSAGRQGRRVLGDVLGTGVVGSLSPGVYWSCALPFPRARRSVRTSI